MARDLIPPSSPAGRPAPDGTPNLIELPPEPQRSPAQPAMREPVGPSQFRNRFGFLLGALAGVLIAAALVGVRVASTDSDAVDDGLAPNWSRWQPSDTTMIGGAQQIAKKVEAEYRHPNGDQLVVVSAQPLVDQTVALRSSAGTVSLFDSPGVAYTLDGLGPQKSIYEGVGSEQRMKLVQREALELALYTFRYLPEVEQVVTFLPPPPPTEKQIEAERKSSAAKALAQIAVDRAIKSGKEEDLVAAQAAMTAAEKVSTTNMPDAARRAVFYRPGDLKQQLESPLGTTLPAKLAKSDNLTQGEIATIDALTTSNMFVWSQPDPARPILLLDR